MRAWLSYAAATAALLVGAALAVGALVGPGAESAVWLAAGVAYPVQLLGFGLLVAGRRKGRDFVVSWATGMVIRFVAIAGVAFWVTRGDRFDAAVALVSLVGFVFVLVLLEPLFLRLTD